MDDLLHLKRVAINTLVDLNKDTREDVKLALSNLFIKPLVIFPEAYDEFVFAIGHSGEATDRWLNIQMNILTDLGPNRDALLNHFFDIQKKVLNETPGGQLFIKPEAEVKKSSFLLAFMLRVYGDSIVIDVTPEGGGKDE
jgi:hypothetical protein